MSTTTNSAFSELIKESTQTVQALLMQEAAFEQIVAVAVQTLQAGGKILTCGNGDSALNAWQLAEELSHRCPSSSGTPVALCLNTDLAELTGLANEFGFESVFAGPLEKLAQPKDLLVCFAETGQASNIANAIEASKTRQVKSVAFLGKGGGSLKGMAMWEFIVIDRPAIRTQEICALLRHILVERIAQELKNPTTTTSVATPSPSAVAQPMTYPRSLLVVDDDYNLAQAVSELLRYENCTVDIAGNGMEALMRLREKTYGGVVCDLQMPLVNGEALYGEVVKVYPYLANRFIFVSSYAAHQPGITDFIHRTNNVFLEKPILMARLNAAVEKLFSK